MTTITGFCWSFQWIDIWINPNPTRFILVCRTSTQLIAFSHFPNTIFCTFNLVRTVHSGFGNIGIDIYQFYAHCTRVDIQSSRPFSKAYEYMSDSNRNQISWLIDWFTVWNQFEKQNSKQFANFDSWTKSHRFLFVLNWNAFENTLRYALCIDSRRWISHVKIICA